MIRIYVLIDPNTNVTRYVGQTCSRLNTRLFGHLAEGRNKEFPKSAWVRDLVTQGKRPIIREIDQTDCMLDANKLERFYIVYLKALGCDLLNISSGGECGNRRGVRLTQEQKKKMSAAKDAIKKPISLIHSVTGEVVDFTSISEAAKNLKLDKGNLQKVVKGLVPRCGGWRVVA